MRAWSTLWSRYFITAALATKGLPCAAAGPARLLPQRGGAAAARGMVSTRGARSAAAGAGGVGAAAATIAPPVNVDVTRHNFSEVLPTVRAALNGCDYFALDCEMTGLFTDANKSDYMDDVQDRYEKMCESTRSFIITQYGLSCFKRIAGDAGQPPDFVSQTFNFWVFPQPVPNSLAAMLPEGVANRRFLCEAGSLAFLSEQGFDFNTCIGQGIPFLPLRQRDNLLSQLDRARDREREFTTGGNAAADGGQQQQQRAVDITEEADKLFVESLAASVEAWLAAGEDEEGAAELTLPPTNAYKRLLTYQTLQSERFSPAGGHPGFIVRKVERRGGSPVIVLLRTPTPEAAAALEARLHEERLATVHAAAGFSTVFEMMRDCGKPAVGHNLAFDLAYSLFSFAEGWLPGAWRDYRKMARSWLPGGIYDTKYLSRNLPEVFGRATSLSEVYAALVEGERAVETAALLERAGMGEGLPRVRHALGFDKYRGLPPGAKAHEAGYDAYMTGAAFACILPLLEAKAKADPEGWAALVAGGGVGGGSSGTDAEEQQQERRERGEKGADAANGAGESTEEEEAAAAAAAAAAAGEAVAAAAPLMGRINLTHSDLPFVSLWGPDPPPARPRVVHLSWEEGGLSDDPDGAVVERRGDVVRVLARRLQRVLPRGDDGRPGRARITLLPSSAAFAELDTEIAAAAVVAGLPGGAPPTAGGYRGSSLVAVPYSQYAAVRYARFADESAAAAAPAEAPASAARGGAAAAAGRRGGGGEEGAPAAKRARLTEQQEEATGNRCSIM